MGALGIALVAGGLSTVNPCGFALLPAFLSFYVGADEKTLPSACNRALQGLLVGAGVSAGFLTVFAAVGIPLSYGASRLTNLVPWAGLVVGVILVVAGALVAAGQHMSLSIRNPVRVQRDRRPRTMYLFGIGYGIASIGCALPVFLAVVGASSASPGLTGSLGVLAAYGIGVTVVLVALSLGAALVRQGLASRLKRALPHMHRISGALLIVTGAYLTYYWARVGFTSVLTLSRDPLIGLVERFVASVQRVAVSGTGRWLLFAAGAVVTLAAVLALNSRASSEPTDE